MQYSPKNTEHNVDGEFSVEVHAQPADNPAGAVVRSFKQPTSHELAHDF